MNLVTLLPLLLRLVAIIPQLRDLAAKNPEIVNLLKTITEAAGQLFPSLGSQPTVDTTIEHIKKVQTKLNKAGANPQLDVDGSIGPKTQAAVKAFQSAHGLVPDGWPGPETDKELDKI